jgi:hypothetical protein
MRKMSLNQVAQGPVCGSLEQPVKLLKHGVGGDVWHHRFRATPGRIWEPSTGIPERLADFCGGRGASAQSPV